MNFNNRITKLNRWDYVSIIVSCTQVLVSFYTDRFIFSGIQSQYVGYFIFDKIVYLVMAFAFWAWIIKATLGGGYRKQSFGWLLMKASSIYMFIFLICIICVYPMIEFGGDIPFFIEPAKEYRLSGGLHWISTLLYVIGYMAFPIRGGATILMCIMSSVSYGYVLVKARELDVSKKWLVLMFLPPFIMEGIYPTRLTMMTLVFIVYFTWLYSNYINKEELTKKKIFLFLIYTGMLSVWRMESKYLLLFAPILLMLAFRQKFTKKLLLKYFILVLIAHMIFNIPDKFKEKITIEQRLIPIVGYVLPLMEMEGVNWSKTDQYDVLNGYLNMDNMTIHEAELGIELYRADYLAALGDVFRYDEASVSMKEYAWTAVKACLIHPIEYLNVRLKSFVITANGSTFPFYGSINNEDGSENTAREICLYILNGNRLTGIDTVHGNVWSVIWRNIVSFSKYLTWQLWLTLFGMFYIVIYTIRKRDIFTLFYACGLWVFTGIVFLFCPACGFKYYWPVYTFVILFFLLVLKSEKKLIN